MNIVFVENSQNDVDGNQGRQDQVGFRREGRLKYLRSALKSRMNGSRHNHRTHHILNGDYSIPERDIWGEIKGKGDCRKLALVGNGQRRLRELIMRERAERNRLPGTGLDIDVLERVWRLLELLSHFHHHVVLVNSFIHRGDLPLAKGVV